MSWIESHDDIGDHKKTQYLCEALKITVPTAVGHLHLLWHYTLRVAWSTGDLTGHMPRAIARACYWEGDPKAFLKAIQDSGYMDDMRVHDWEVYARSLIYQRGYNKNRRHTAKKQPNYTCNTPVKPPLPNPTQPNPTQPNQRESEKPTLAMVLDCFKSLGHPEEAEPFYDHYEANGWKIGGVANIQSWPAACRSWLRKPFRDKPKSSQERLKTRASEIAKEIACL